MSKNQNGLGLLVILILIAVVVAALAGWRIHIDRNNKKLTVTGGIPLDSVPAQFRDEAKSKGYYCPSWAAKPGEIASHICSSISN